MVGLLQGTEMNQELKYAILAVNLAQSTVRQAKDHETVCFEALAKLCPRKLGDVVTVESEVGSYVAHQSAQMAITSISAKEHSDSNDRWKKKWCWVYYGDILKADGKPGKNRGTRVELIK